MLPLLLQTEWCGCVCKCACDPFQDNPVGNDNHKVNGRLLFEAEPGHASVLPVNNLMKAEDLLGKESLTPEHGGRPAHAIAKVTPHLSLKTCACI